MRTLGIDLAARPATTVACVIRWSPSGAEIELLDLGADDDELLSLIEAVDRTGIDAPFGWPEAFVDAISAYGQGWQAAFATGEAWSLDLRMRLTDRHVRDFTGRWPLSVSTERLGVTALRCLRRLGLLAERGEAVDRTGSGKVLEVYPAAALTMWVSSNRNTLSSSRFVGTRGRPRSRSSGVACWQDGYPSGCRA